MVNIIINCVKTCIHNVCTVRGNAQVEQIAVISHGGQHHVCDHCHSFLQDHCNLLGCIIIMEGNFNGDLFLWFI
jgi:hypothetical protein